MSKTLDNFKQGGWRVPERSILKDCPRTKELPTPTINIEHDVWRVIEGLCDEIKIEWQMMLTGTLDEENNECHVTGYIIPRQTVGAASVENHEVVDAQYVVDNNIVVGIHSHGTMGVFFSPTDDQANMSSIKYHIVVNNAHQHEATARIKTMCGGETSVVPEVAIINAPEESAIDIVGIDNIQEKVYTTVTPPYKNPNAYYPYYPADSYWDKGAKLRQEAIDKYEKEYSYGNA